MSEFMLRVHVERECRRLERERLSIQRQAQHRAAWLLIRSGGRRRPARPVVHWLGTCCVRIGVRLCRWAAGEQYDYGANASVD